MDWLRRNWPDLLIGIALIAVIAGIVATLLTGGSFFPIGPGQGTAPVSTPNVAPTTPPPAGPGVVQEDVPGVTPESPAETPDAVVPTPDAGATPSQEQPQAGANGGAIAVLPPAGEGAAPAASDGAGQPADEPATPDVGQAGAEQPAATAPAAAPAEQPASTAAPTAPYRVSVGAFGSEENAQGQAETFREAGFPVFLGRQGDLVLVLVGPYDTEQEAEQAVSRIRSGDFGIDPVIYRFQPDDETAASPPAQQETRAQEAASTAAPAAAETQAAAPESSAEGSFLQVGAYGTRESALPQIERLESMGFDVTERTESGLIKLLVGPFEGDALATARQQLQAEGIEHFAR